MHVCILVNVFFSPSFLPCKGINGFIYSNLKGLEMNKGDKVEWYLISMGNEVDLHSVHFHGQTIVYRTEQPHRADVYELFPGK